MVFNKEQNLFEDSADIDSKQCSLTMDLFSDDTSLSNTKSEVKNDAVIQNKIELKNSIAKSNIATDNNSNYISIADYIDEIDISNIFTDWVRHNKDEIKAYHEQIIKIYDLFKNNKLHHSYRFTGAEGIGKSVFAYELIFRIFLPDYAYNPQKYVQSPTLLRILNSSHPDFLLISPALNENKAQKKDVINIDSVRRINQFIQQSAYETSYKIILINSIDNLNNNAANALLKSLEEPSKNSLFILINHNPHQILPTIKSRTIEYKIKPLDIDYKINIIKKCSKLDLKDTDIDFLINYLQLPHKTAISFAENNVFAIYDLIIEIISNDQALKMSLLSQLLEKLKKDTSQININLFFCLINIILQTTIKLTLDLDLPKLSEKEISAMLKLKMRCKNNPLILFQKQKELNHLYDQCNLLNLDFKYNVITMLNILL